MSEDIVILSDGEEAGEPPVKLAKIENTVSTNGDHENGDEQPSTSNGSSKKTARKRMSSFTPKLFPTEVVDLDVDDDKADCESKDEKHPELEEVKNCVQSFLRTIRGYVNDVEHSKIKKKMDKRIDLVEKALSKLKFESLIEKLKVLEDKVVKKPNNVFEITKEVLDEFEKYKIVENRKVIKPEKIEKSVPEKNGQGKTKAKESENKAEKEISNEESYKLQKRYAHIKKLQKAQAKCAKHIRKLEEKEMDLDDLESENSTYIQIDRFKKRFMKVQRAIAKLQEVRMSTGRACDKKFKTEASRIPAVNVKIMDLVNKTRKFPDYQDILRIYKEVNEDKNLGYSSASISNYGEKYIHSY